MSFQNPVRAPVVSLRVHKLQKAVMAALLR